MSLENVELSTEPVELLDAGDSVVALVHMKGRGRGSGVEVQGGVDVHVMTLGPGGVSFFRIYPGDAAADRARLDDRQMEAVVLRVTEGLEEPVIAARLGVSESEVASILDRVFESFRDLPSSEPVR